MTDITRIAVPNSDIVLEATPTGAILECENTGRFLQVVQFTSPTEEIYGMAIIESMDDLLAEYQSNSYVKIPKDFKVVSELKERHDRATLAGSQGLPLSEEMKNDLSMLTAYLRGLKTAIADNYLSTAEELERNPNSRELAYLAEEAAELEQLQDAALEVRLFHTSMSQSFRDGRDVKEASEMVRTSNTHAENYLQGLRTREIEVSVKQLWLLDELSEDPSSVEKSRELMEVNKLVDLIQERFESMETIMMDADQRQKALLKSHNTLTP